MHAALHLLAPLALFVPALVVGGAVLPAPAAGLTVAGVPLGPLSRADNVGPARAEAEQVRVEQRVTIRISPRAAPMPMMPSAFMDSSELDAGGSHIVERKMGKCLALSAIAGVSPGPKNKLVLLLRDSRVVSASLDKSCTGRDFYSGFLVARNADGMVCTGRDELLARSGSKCKVNGFKQLIEVDD